MEDLFLIKEKLARKNKKLKRLKDFKKILATTQPPAQEPAPQELPTPPAEPSLENALETITGL